ncbi:MAG: GNAT family N-acetyltransferase [Candidatus Dormibacterales bacterium]
MEKIELVPLTKARFDVWLQATIVSYAQEHVAAGNWSEAESLQRSRAEHERLLPKGLSTAGAHLWSIVRSGDPEPVGMLWMQEKQAPKPHAFVYNIEIYPPFRRRGYAEQAMTRLEEEARGLNLEGIRLHVFGHNGAARPLYEKLGYEPTSIQMLKRLT